MPFVLRKHLHDTAAEAAARDGHDDVVEVEVLDFARPTGEVLEAVQEIYQCMRFNFDKRFVMRFGRSGAGSMVQARYRELRREGLSHEESLDVMRDVVSWCKRNWYGNPVMRAYCRPSTIFRKSRFHERRTGK